VTDRDWAVAAFVLLLAALIVAGAVLLGVYLLAR
jgi:hypothetical protein